MRSSHTRAAGLAIAAALALAGPLAAQTEFQPRVIDPEATGDCKGVADIDGDTLVDVVLGGSRLAWYRTPAFGRRVVSPAAVEFSTDMQVADVDGDGDPDIIVPDGGSGALSWFENPRPLASPRNTQWARHTIGFAGAWIHDVEAAPMLPGGPLCVVTRGAGLTLLWSPAWTPGVAQWTPIPITPRPGEGLGLGDIDGDGDTDVAVDGVWLENPGGAMAGPWTEHAVATGWPERVGVRVARIDADTRPDIVLAASESEGRMVWYQAPPDPKTGVWTEHIIDPSVDFVHTFQVTDMDRDGRPDVAFAEMAQSVRRRVGYYANPGNAGPWRLVLASTEGSHNIRVADLDNNGWPDIVGANWQGPPAVAWFQTPYCYANCDGSTAAPILTAADLTCFMDRYMAGDPRADCDGRATTPVLDIHDFQCFLTRYAAGCP